MIVFDLACDGGHRFEGWFGSSQDFDDQHAGGLVNCPECGSSEIAKAPMAPAVPRKSNQQNEGALRADRPAMARGPLPQEVASALAKLAEVQAKALESSTWVGEEFVERTRAMHYGEQEPEVIHGRAEIAEAIELIEEGIAVAPLPFPIRPPEELN
jgi:hypothetical protein